MANSQRQAEIDRITKYAEKIDEVLKDMVRQLFIEQPSDPLDFMIDYLSTQKQNRDSMNEDSAPSEPASGGPKKVPPKKRRTGVSAESSSTMADEGSRQRVVHPKSDAQKAAIRETVQSNILFSSLESEQLNIVVDAMFEQRAEPGDSIIVQGAEGDNFFIVEEGSLECFVKVNKDQPPLMVKTYAHGESFGELALMYNCPRAATIKAKTPVKLWALDRVTFRAVLMDTNSEKRKRFEVFLENVDLLSSLEKTERSKVADALQEASYAAGDVIVKQGEPGEHIFFIEEGLCRATRVLGNGQPDVVMDLKAGGYFGELALLNGAPRAASVIAVTAVKLATLDRACFHRLLGPVEEILARNSLKYAEFEKKNYENKLAAVRGPEAPPSPAAPVSAAAGAEQDAADAADAAQMARVKASRRRRASVSSESVNMKNFEVGAAPEKLETFAKTEPQRQRILASISKNFLFSSLDAAQTNLVIDTMREMKFAPGQEVIKQGDTGDFFYVVDAGTLDCYVQKSKDQAPFKVKTYNHGESFGELALMYNCPRAATIKAGTDCVLWAMERVPFRRILCETTQQRRATYETFLESIPLLASLDRYERAKVSDALIEQSFASGDTVIRIGDPGDNFYIIEEGEAVATKPNATGQQVEVMQYARGGYFGELALLSDVPRAANVVAKTPLKTVYLDRAAFVRLLGPCEDILKRNSENYAQQQARLG